MEVLANVAVVGTSGSVSATNNVGQGREDHARRSARQASKLRSRIRRIQGQVAGIERALERDISCHALLQLIAGARGALDGFMGEMLDEHVRTRIVDGSNSEQANAAVELIDSIRPYLR